MSGEELRLDAPRAERAGNALAQTGADLARLRAGIGVELEAVGDARPWGRDTLGAAFQQNYDRYATQLLTAWADVAAYVESLGETVVETVHTTIATDVASSRRSTGI